MAAVLKNPSVPSGDPFLEAVRERPVNRYLAVLHSARPHARWGRWSILAEPSLFYRYTDHSHWIGNPPEPLASITWTHDPIIDVDQILAVTRSCGSEVQASEGLTREVIPFSSGGWIGYFSYDLGRIIEPTAQASPGPHEDRSWPLIELGWCPDACIFDNRTGKWQVVGEGLAESDPHADSDDYGPEVTEPALSPSLASSLSANKHDRIVRRTLEYIRAGDIFQANITQRLTAPFRGSTRSLFQRAMILSGARYGACLEFSQDQSLISLSPELFFQIDPVTRLITTRPIKGTRPDSATAQELEHSAKDAAELHMIVDLMRNDLGRICEFGSVRVVDPRSIETHPTVHHGVSEITGQLRTDISIGDILRATFPGGSVTGAPKIRAMQIIDELEPVRRGPYCGAIGFIDNAGGACFNIGIRTMMLSGQRPADRYDFIDGRIDYGAGGGIVADSIPAEEYLESMDKAAVFRMALQAMDTPDIPSQEVDVSFSRRSVCDCCWAAEKAQI